MEKTRAPYGASMLVAVGWFATVIAAAAVGNASLPDDPRRECGEFGCLDAMDFLPALAVLLGVPLLALLAAVTAGVTRWPMPAALAGTLSALATVAVAVLVVAILAPS